MKTKELLKLVEPRWHQEFLRFIDSGDASEGFLAYVDGDADAQIAVEKAFDAQAKAFEELASSLASALPSNVSRDIEDKKRATTASANMTKAVKQVLALSPREQQGVLQKLRSALTRLGPQSRTRLQDLAKSFSSIGR